ncbi:VanW family protein [Patescibacteria group bacterium]
MKSSRVHHTDSNIPKKAKTYKYKTKFFLVYFVISMFLISFGAGTLILLYEKKYSGNIYPNVYIDGVPFGGKSPDDVKKYWQDKNQPFSEAVYEFQYEDYIATASATEFEVGYDADLSAKQAYLIGRSGNIFTDIYYKYWRQPVNLTPYFRWKEDVLDQALLKFSDNIDIKAQEALFNFDGGKVTAFKPSSDGRKVNVDKTKERFTEVLLTIPTTRLKIFKIPIAVDVIIPIESTDSVNSFGIKELIGRGYSEFSGSIPGRIHNVALAASRFNGVLIAPGETVSFNKTLGDVSAATGYQSAYIIKSGRTVLGDGGGVCQVSTTLFRASLDAGLPIVERRPHAYRVHYYEDGGFKAGLDATVFDPTADLKITNNSPAHILIQTKTDTKNKTLVFELYGTNDGRKAQISNHRVWGITPPPPDLEQEDPTLKVGVRKQVDWAAWGAKAEFDYTVSRNGETLIDTSFFSNFRPWQAVYLVGTMP